MRSDNQSNNKQFLIHKKPSSTLLKGIIHLYSFKSQFQYDCDALSSATQIEIQGLIPHCCYAPPSGIQGIYRSGEDGGAFRFLNVRRFGNFTCKMKCSKTSNQERINYNRVIMVFCF